MKKDFKSHGLVFTQDPKKHLISIDSYLLEKFIVINKNSKNILEVGTGCGVISLLLAKRTTAKIDAIDIDSEQVEIAKNNFENNYDLLRTKNINFITADFKTYLKDENIVNTYDIIFSNPPYFKKEDESLMKKNTHLQNARNELNLSLEDIFASSKRLLKDSGKLFLILRTDRIDEVISLGIKYNIQVNKLQFVHSKIGIAKFALVSLIKKSSLGVKVEMPIFLFDKNIYDSYYEK